MSIKYYSNKNSLELLSDKEGMAPNNMLQSDNQVLKKICIFATELCTLATLTTTLQKLSGFQNHKNNRNTIKRK